MLVLSKDTVISEYFHLKSLWKSVKVLLFWMSESGLLKLLIRILSAGV